VISDAADNGSASGGGGGGGRGGGGGGARSTRYYTSRKGGVQLVRDRPWLSPRSGQRYFLRHNLTVPSISLFLSIETLAQDGEVATGCSAAAGGSSCSVFVDAASVASATLRGEAVSSRFAWTGLNHKAREHS